MKKLTPILLLVLSCTCLKAQTNLDSLLAIWEDENQADSTRTDAYVDYLWGAYLGSNPDSAFILAEDLITFGKENQFPRATADGIHMQGNSFLYQSEFPQALDYYQRSLKIKEGIGYKSGSAASLTNIGNIHYYLGNYIQALNNFQRSLKIYDELRNKKGIARSLYSIGNIYYVQSNYPQALNYYQRSLKIREEIGDKSDISPSLLVIGMIYQVQDNYPQALDYYEQSLKIMEEIGDKRGSAPPLTSIGKIYQAQNNFTYALDYYQRSLKIFEELGDRQGIAGSLHDIGTIHYSQSNYPEALDYYKRSLKIQEDIGDKRGIARTLFTTGSIYAEQGKYNAAIASCQKSLTLGIELGSLSRQKNACSCLYEANKGLALGNKALQYHERMVVLDDSLNVQETAKKLQQMEFDKQVLLDSIATAEKEREVQLLHERQMRAEEKTRNIGFGIGFLFVLLAAGFYSRWRYVKKSKATLQDEKDRSENLLLNILPPEIAEELKATGRAEARNFDKVSVIFTDFKGFTLASAKLGAQELVAEINTCFEAFDAIMEKYDIEKIKTIGDAYMAAGGLPVPSEDSVKKTVLASLEMQAFITARKKEMDAAGKPAFEMRAGIDTGPVVAGIVGVKKFQYDIWGDTVNTASRMESSGEVNEVNVSQATYELLKEDSDFTFKKRGKIEAKGKGEIDMYFVRKS